MKSIITIHHKHGSMEVDGTLSSDPKYPPTYLIPGIELAISDNGHAYILQRCFYL